MEPIERAIREETLDGDARVVRGSPLTIEGLLRHAQRTARVFSLRGAPLYAVSAMVTDQGRSVENLLESPNLRTRVAYASTTVGRLTGSAFDVLPTFAAPHVSIVWPAYDELTAQVLLTALAPIQRNPYREGRWR